MKPREKKRRDFRLGGSARNKTTQFWLFFEVYGKRKSMKIYDTWISAQINENL